MGSDPRRERLLRSLVAPGVVDRSYRVRVRAMPRKARTIARMSGSRRLVAAQFVAAALGLEVAFRIVPIGTLLRVWSRLARSPLGRRLPFGRSRLDPLTRVQLLTAAAQLVRPARGCLPRAALLWWDRLASGDPACLVVGVRVDPAFEAHAWVEIAGVPIGERSAAGSFQALAVWHPGGAPGGAGLVATQVTA